jgi:polysaccharide pyruvyl transferase WcaK-like protein
MHEFMNEVSLDDSLVIGYYGGGNFGDELLLEVLMNLIQRQHATRVAVAYRNPAQYGYYHRDYGFTVIDSQKPKQFLATFLRRRTIVIGGGGHWGLDVNRNILFLSMLLWFGRWFLGKRVYLLGVGYYGSSSRMGHLAAWFAGKAANQILARDPETQAAFGQLSQHVRLVEDIAFSIDAAMLQPFAGEADALARSLHLSDDMVLIAIRRFQAKYRNRYDQVISELIQRQPERQFILTMLEPATLFPEGAQLLSDLAARSANVQLLDCARNPLVVCKFFQDQAPRFRFITPQFHAIAMALYCGIPFFPVSYDNKVSQLITNSTHQRVVPIRGLTVGDLEVFLAKGAVGA